MLSFKSSWIRQKRWLYFALQALSLLSPSTQASSTTIASESLLKRVFNSSCEINNISGIRKANKNESLLEKFCTALPSSTSNISSNLLLFCKITGRIDTDAETTDNENSISVYGKIIKIYNLLKNMSSNDSSFKLEDISAKITNVNSSFEKMSSDSNVIGTPNNPGNSNATIFSQLNAILDSLRSSLNVTYSPSTNNEVDPCCALLQAVTQAGSRGFNPTLVNAISEQGSEIDNNKAIAILRSNACWNTVFGLDPAPEKNPIGTICEQIKAANIYDDDLNKNLIEIASSWKNVHLSIEPKKLTKVYSLLVPSLNSSGKAPLDYLGDYDSNSNVVYINVKSTNSLTLQECLTYLLSGATLKSSTNDNGSTNDNDLKNGLANRIGSICEELLKILKKSCCGEAAQWAVTLQEQLASADTDHLLTALQAFNKRSDSAGEAVENSSANTTTDTVPEGSSTDAVVTTDTVEHNNLSSYLEALAKKLDSEATKASDDGSGDCRQLVDAFGGIVAALKKRVAECDNPIALLTNDTWRSAIEGFANSATTLKEKLTMEGTCCPDCQNGVGTNSESIEAPLTALVEFAQSLPQALQAKALGTLAANLVAAEAALKVFVKAPDAEQRSSLTETLKNHSPPTDGEISSLQKLSEEASFLNKALGGDLPEPDVLEGDNLDFACAQAEKITNALDLILADLDILKANAEPISDVPFGEALQQCADALEGFQETWENLEKELTEVSSTIQEELSRGQACLGDVTKILREIAVSYGTCCKEEVAGIKSLAQSAATLEAYLSQVQSFLAQAPPASLPPADNYKNITFDQDSSGLTETLTAVNSAIEKLCSKISEDPLVLTPSAEPEVPTQVPCTQIEVYINLALGSLEKLPSLLDALKECVLSRTDTTLPTEVRANLQSLINQLVQQTFPTISCDYCNHSDFEEGTADRLKAALNTIKEKAATLIEALQDKCCLQEGRLLRQLSNNIKALDNLISNSTSNLAKDIIDLRDTTILQTQVEVLTEALKAATLETHNSSESLREIINALSEFRKGWAETFNGEANVESIALPNDLLLCDSKRESFETIDESLSSLAKSFNTVSTSIKEINHSHNATAISFVESLQNALTTLEGKLPTQSLCPLCKESTELQAALSAKELLSGGMSNLNSALGNMLDALNHHAQCDSLTRSCLAFSTAFEEYKTSIIEFITSKDELSLDKVLNQLSSFNRTLKDNSKDTAFILSSLAGELSKAAQFNATNLPMKNPSSTDTVPQHGDTLVNTVAGITEGLTDLASEIQKLKDSWKINPPSYDTPTYEKLSAIVDSVSKLEENVIRAELFSPSCPLFDFPFQGTSNSLDIQLSNTSLLANLNALLNAYEALRVAPLVSALGHLNDVLLTCSNNPVTAVQIVFSISDSHDVPILCTTRPNNVLQLWQETFVHLPQNLQTDSSKAALSIKTLASKVKELHEELGGKIITTNPASYFFENITLARKALAGQITQTGETVSKLLAQIQTQPFATNKELSEAFRVTLNFLGTLKQELAQRTQSEHVDVEGLHDVSTAIESVQFGTENFERGNCSQAFGMALGTFSRNVETVCAGLTTLSDLVDPTPQSDSLTSISAFAASMESFASSTSYFLSSLVPLPDEVLCDETYATERINELNAGISELATALGVSSTTGTDSTQEVSSIEAILANLQEVFCGEESKLSATFTSLIKYAQESYEKDYSYATVESLFRILFSFKGIYDSLSAIGQRFAEEGSVLLCREHAENSSSAIEQMETIASGLNKANLLMERFYNAIRMRFWTSYQDSFCTLHSQVNEHTSFLGFLQQQITANNEALRNNKGNYEIVIDAVGSLNDAFEKVSPLGINLSDIDSGNIENTLKNIQTAITSLKDYKLPYHDELITEKDRDGAFFETLRKVFSLTEHIYNHPDRERKKAPLTLIQEDLNAIHKALNEQYQALNTLAFFPVGAGNSHLQKSIQELASFFDVPTSTIGENGRISNVFTTIFTTISQLVKKFENLSPEGSPSLLDSPLPTQGDIEASFTNLNKVFMALADRFNPEQCPILVQTYVQLAREIKDLAEHLSSLTEGTEFLKGASTLLDTTIENLNEISVGLAKYLEENKNLENSCYCASSYIYPSLQKIVQAVKDFTKSSNNVNSPVGNISPRDLKKAHEQLTQSLDDLTSTLRSQTDRIQAFGLETPWPPEKLANLNTLISFLESTENAEPSLPDHLNGILEALGGQSICTFEDKEISNLKFNESKTFLNTLINEKIPVFKTGIIYLKDIVQRLMFDQRVEAAWLKILHGASMLNQLLGNDNNPLEQLQALTRNLKALVSGLQTPLQNYLETILPSGAQLEALENLAALLTSDFAPPYSALPFTSTSWEEDVTRTLEEVERFALVLSELNQNFQQSLFTKQPDLEAALVELIQRINILADVCQTKPASTALSSNVYTQTRARLQKALILIAEELQALLNTLHDSSVEQKLRLHVAGIQSIFEVLPHIAQIFVDELNNVSEASRRTKAEALYKQLQGSLFANPQALSLNEALGTLTAIWAPELDWSAFLEKAASAQSAAYVLTVTFLKLVAAPTAADFPERMAESNLIKLDPVQIPVNLERIRQAFASLSEVLNEGLEAMRNLAFDPDRVATLIAAGTPLHLLASLKPALLAFSEALSKAPGSIYDEVAEDVERLRDIAAICPTFDLVLQTAQSLIDVQATLPWYRLLEQLRILATQAETFNPTEGLTFADSLFAKLASFAEIMRGLDNAPEATTNLLKELSAALDQLGLPSPDSDLEPNPSFLHDPRKVIEAEIEATIQRIQSPISTWTDTWLSTPYMFNETLIRNVETFHETLPYLAYNWKPLQGTLEAFLSRLKTPTCCETLNTQLFKIYKNLLPIRAFFETLATLPKLPSLEKEETSKPAAPSEAIKTLTTLLEGIKNNLSSIGIDDCQNANWLQKLEGIAINLADFKTPLNTIATYLNLEVGTPTITPLPSVPSCERTNILLSRLSSELNVLTTNAPKSLKVIKLEPGESRPYFPDFIETLKNFSKALDSFADSLNEAIPSEAPCHYRTSTNDELTRPCPLHNMALHAQTKSALVSSVGELKTFVDRLIEQLNAFKYSRVGEIIHQLKLEASATQYYLEALIPNSETSAPFPTFDSGDLLNLQRALEEQRNVWQALIEEAPIWKSEDIFDHEETLNTLLTPVLERTQALQALTGKALPPEPAAAYGPEQIEADLEAIQDTQDDIVETLTGLLYEACTKGSPRFVSTSAAAVVSALETLYGTLEDASQHLKLDSSGGTTTLPSIEGALAAFIPEELPLLPCHRLVFALSHETCCEPYLDEVEDVTKRYETTISALSGLASAYTPTPDLMSREAALEQIQKGLSTLGAAILDNETQLQTVLDYAYTVETTTCFTDEGPSPETTLKPALDKLITNLDSLSAPLQVLTQARQTLYDLSVLSLDTDWRDLPASIQATLPYYQEEVASTWATLNESLDRQISLLNTLASTIQKLHENDALCFLNSAQYGEKLKAFNSLREILNTSVQALKAYNDRCCARVSYHIVRITKRLPSLQGLSNLQFRNETIDKAEACCEALNAELQKLKEVLNSAPDFDPHALTTFQSLTSIEEIITCMVRAIADYNNVSISPLENFTSLPSFEEAIADLVASFQENGILPNILKSWQETLEEESGKNNNERCYSRAVEPIINSVKELQESFRSRTFSPIPCAQAIKEHWKALAKSFEEGSTMIASLKGIDTLLKTPTCCVLRLQNFQNAYNEVLLIVPSIEKALEAYQKKATLPTQMQADSGQNDRGTSPNTTPSEAASTNEKLPSGFANLINNLNVAAEAFERAILARNEALRCQGPKTTDQADSIDEAFRSLREAMSAVAQSLLPTEEVSENQNDVTSPSPSTSNGTACQQLKGLDTAIAEKLQGITEKLKKLVPSSTKTEESDQGAKETTQNQNEANSNTGETNPNTENYCLGVEDYNKDLTEKLRTFLDTLSKIHEKLHGPSFGEGKTEIVKEFCEYRGVQENEQKCSAVNCITSLDKLVKCFHEVLDHVENTAANLLAGKFYQLAQAAQRLVTRIQQMFKISEAGLDTQQLSSLINGFKEIGTTLDRVGSLLEFKNEGSNNFDSGRIETYDIYEQIANELDTTSSILEIILEKLSGELKPYDSSPNDKSLSGSWKAIQDALTSLATTFENRQSNIPVYQRALIETWENVSKNLSLLKDTLDRRAHEHAVEGSLEENIPQGLYKYVLEQEEKIAKMNNRDPEKIKPISLDSLVENQSKFLTALQAYDPCSALDNSFFQNYATTLTLLKEAFKNSASIFENEIDELVFSNGLNAIADALKILNNAISQPPSELPALVQLGLICHYDQTKLEMISEALGSTNTNGTTGDSGLEKAICHFLTFNINNSTESPEKKTRSELYKKIATEANGVKEAINGVLEGTKKCLVRDYHPQSIAAAQKVLTQLEELTTGLSSFIPNNEDENSPPANKNNPTTLCSFGTVTYCSLCHRKTEQDEETKLPNEQDQDALGSLSATMGGLQAVLREAKAYLEQQCCSRLTACLFAFAQNLETVSVAISKGSSGALEKLNELESSSQTNQEKKLSDIIKEGLKTLQEVLDKGEQNTQNQTGIQKNQTEICSQIASKFISMLEGWNSDTLKPICKAFANTNLPTLSDLSPKKLCNCDSLPEAIGECLTAGSRIDEALNEFARRLSDTISFERMPSLCNLDEALGEFTEGLIELAPKIQNFKVCPHNSYHSNLDGFFEAKESSSTTKSPFKSTLESFKEKLDAVHEIIETNCDKDFIEYLHNANADLGILTAALEDVLKLDSSQQSQLGNVWNDAKENTNFIKYIPHINDAEEKICTTLSEIEKLKSDPGHCSFFRKPDLAKPIQTQTKVITNAFLSLLGKENLEGSPTSPELQKDDTISTEWHTYLSHLNTLQKHLKMLIEQGAEQVLCFSNQKNESKEIASLFLSLSSLLHKKAQIFKQLYTKWTANRDSEGTQSPPCPRWKACTVCQAVNSSCQALSQLSEALTELGNTVSQIGSTFSGSCCSNAFKTLVPVTEGVGKVVVYLQAIAESGQIETLFGETLTVFNEGWVKIRDVLQKLPDQIASAASQKEGNDQTAPKKDKCNISSLVFVLTELSNVFDNSSGGSSTSYKGLLPSFETLFESNRLPSPTFVDPETFEYECDELEAILHLFIHHTTALKDVLNRFVDLSPILLDDGKAQSETNTWDKKLEHMYTATLDIIDAIKSVKGKDNQGPQLCQNCPNQYVAQVLPQILNNLQGIAKAFLELRPSARGSQCCAALGQQLALTQEYLQAVFKWADDQLQDPPVTFAEKIIAENGKLGNELIEKLKDVMDALSSVLATQQKASDSKTLSDFLARPLCSTAQLASSLNTLNEALKQLCDTIKLEVSSTTDSEIRDCETIATDFEISALETFCTTLSTLPDEPSSSPVYHDLQIYIGKFIDLFAQGATTLEKISLNASFQPLCSHCTLNLRSPANTLNQIAQNLTNRLDNLIKSEHRQTTEALQSILNSMAFINQALSAFAELSSLEPYFQGPESSSQTLFTNWKEDLTAIFNQIPDLQESKRPGALSEIATKLKEVEKSLNDFPSWDLQKVELDPATAEEAFRNTFPSQIIEAGEALRNFAELCLYEGIKADKSTENAARNLATTIKAFTASDEDKGGNGPSLAETVPYLTVSWTSLAEASQQLADALSPQDTATVSQAITPLTELLLQTAQALESARPALPSCDLDSYLPAWTEFFNAFTPLAYAAMNLKTTLEATGGNLIEAFIETVLTPFTDLRNTAYKLNKACTGQTPPSQTSPAVSSSVPLRQAYRNLAGAFTHLGKTLLGFVQAARDFHVQNSLLVDLQGSTNLRLTLPALLDSWKDLLSSSSAENPSIPSRSEHPLITAALTQFASLAEPIDTLVKTAQTEICFKPLKTTLDTATLAPDGYPVVVHLFTPAYSRRGLPCQHPQGNILAAHDSLLTRTTETMHAAELLRRQIF